MERATLIRSVPEAIRTMNAMRQEGWFWADEYRAESGKVVQRIVRGRMQAHVSAHLERCRAQGIADRRNGSYTRHLVTELGDIELSVPRTRSYAPTEVLARYARRAAHVDAMILACFCLGLSTRKVGEALLPILGEAVSPATVSRVAKQLDAAVQAFHRRRLHDDYTVLMFDGVVLARKTGAGALRRPVLVALGIREDNSREIIDFRLAAGESQAAWEAFLNDLYRRGLAGHHARLAVTDGGAGLLAALPLVYPHLAVQRCWAHKARNVLDKVRKADREAVKRELHQVMYATGLAAARRAARHFADTWEALYPKAVACLRVDLDELLVHLRVFKAPLWRKAARTTNAIERCFREVKRRTRPMGVMADTTSIERLLLAVFSRHNRDQGIPAPVLLTQNS